MSEFQVKQKIKATFEIKRKLWKEDKGKFSVLATTRKGEEIWINSKPHPDVGKAREGDTVTWPLVESNFGWWTDFPRNQNANNRNQNANSMAQVLAKLADLENRVKALEVDRDLPAPDDDGPTAYDELNPPPPTEADEPADSDTVPF